MITKHINGIVPWITVFRIVEEITVPPAIWLITFTYYFCSTGALCLIDIVYVKSMSSGSQLLEDGLWLT
ncbi:MAG: hypothetical protein IIA75_09025 [Proteobacteria bacterium]|nr:hypothetical protein [Pseudomonadota bacterium]